MRNKHVGPNRKLMTILFEFETVGGWIYRGVKAADGGYRLDKRGKAAKTFQAVMWSGEQGLVTQFKAITRYTSKELVGPTPPWISDRLVD